MTDHGYGTVNEDFVGCRCRLLVEPFYGGEITKKVRRLNSWGDVNDYFVVKCDDGGTREVYCHSVNVI